MTVKPSTLKQGSTLYAGQTGETALGRLWIACTENGLAAVAWGMDQASFEGWLVKRFHCLVVFDQKRTREYCSQMAEYLQGKRRHFNFVIDWTVMRPFQQSVLRATYAIPYGETRTYREIAEQIGHPQAARAVGRAEARNPMPLVLPCHRVIGRDGKLHGYGMGEGIHTKEWLLQLEGAVIA